MRRMDKSQTVLDVTRVAIGEVAFRGLGQNVADILFLFLLDAVGLGTQTAIA